MQRNSLVLERLFLSRVEGPLALQEDVRCSGATLQRFWFTNQVRFSFVADDMGHWLADNSSYQQFPAQFSLHFDIFDDAFRRFAECATRRRATFRTEIT